MTALFPVRLPGRSARSYPRTPLIPPLWPYSFIADIEELAWTTLVCLGRGLEWDVPVYQPMHSLNQALHLLLSFGIESL